MLQVLWDDYLQNRRKSESSASLGVFTDAVFTLENKDVIEELSHLRDPVSVGEILCKDLVGHFGCLQPSKDFVQFPRDLRLLLAAVDRFSKAGFACDRNLCENLLSLLEMYVKSMLDHPPAVSLRLPSPNASSLWHSEDRHISLAHFVIDLTLSSSSRACGVDSEAFLGGASWLDGLLMMSVLENIAVAAIRRGDAIQCAGLPEKIVRKLSDLFVWIALRRSQSSHGNADRLCDLDSPVTEDEDDLAPLQPKSFTEALMAAFLSVLTSLTGLMLRQCGPSTRKETMDGVVKQLFNRVVDVIRSSNDHLATIFSKPELLESIAVSRVPEIGNAFHSLGSLMSLAVCINSQHLDAAQSRFALNSMDKVGVFKNLLAFFDNCSIITSISALTEARRIVLPMLTRLIKLSFLFIPRIKSSMTPRERRSSSSSHQRRRQSSSSLASDIPLPFMRDFHHRLTVGLLNLVQKSNSRHIQLAILSDLSIRDYRQFVTVSTVIQACLANFTSFAPVVQDVTLQFLESCYHDNRYVDNSLPMSFAPYMEAIVWSNPKAVTRIFNHLKSVVSHQRRAVIKRIIDTIVLPILAGKKIGIAKTEGLHSASVDELEKGGRLAFIQGAVSLFAGSLACRSELEIFADTQQIGLEKFIGYLPCISLRSDCLKVLSWLALSKKYEVTPDSSLQITCIQEGTMQELFRLCLTAPSPSRQKMTLDLRELDADTVSLHADGSRCLASLLWKNDFVFQRFLEASGHAAVAGQTLQILKAFALYSSRIDGGGDAGSPKGPSSTSGYGSSDGDVPQYPSKSTVDERLLESVALYVEAQLMMMSRTSQYVFVDYHGDTIETIIDCEPFLQSLLTHLPQRLGPICNILLDLSTAKFNEGSLRGSLLSQSESTLVVEDEVEFLREESVSVLDSMSLSSSNSDVSNGYRADDSMSMTEWEKDDPVKTSHTDKDDIALLFPELCSVVLGCLSVVCSGKDFDHFTACEIFHRLQSIADSSEWNLHLLNEQKTFSSMIKDFAFVFCDDRHENSGLAQCIAEFLCTLALRNLSGPNLRQIFHQMNDPLSNKTLLLSVLDAVSNREGLNPSGFAVLGKGIQIQVGESVFRGSSPAKGLPQNLITLPLKPSDWLPTSSGFSLSLWLKLSQQHCLLYAQPDWIEKRTPRRLSDKGLSGSPSRIVHSLSKKQETSATLVSFGPDDSLFCIDTELTEANKTVMLCCRWGEKNMLSMQSSIQLDEWVHVVVTVAKLQRKGRTHVSEVRLFLNGLRSGKVMIPFVKPWLESSASTRLAFGVVGDSQQNSVVRHLNISSEKKTDKTPLLTFSNSYVMFLGNSSLFKGTLFDDEVSSLHSFGPDSLDFAGISQSIPLMDPISKVVSIPQDIPVSAQVKERLQLLYTPGIDMSVYYQFNLPNSQETSLPATFASIFRPTAAKVVPRSLSVDPRELPANLSDSVTKADSQGLDRALHHVGGINCVLGLLAKLTSSIDVDDVLPRLLRLLLTLDRNSKAFNVDLKATEGYHLLKRILCSRKYPLHMATVKVLFDAVCDKPVIIQEPCDYQVMDSNEACVINPRLLEDILLDSVFWRKCYDIDKSGSLLAKLISSLNALVDTSCQHHEANKKVFEEAEVVKRVLQNCQICDEEEKNALSSSVTAALQTLIGYMLDPPDQSNLGLVFESLLTSHPNLLRQPGVGGLDDLEKIAFHIQPASTPMTSTPRKRVVSFAAEIKRSSSDSEGLNRILSRISPAPRKKLSYDNDADKGRRRDSLLSGVDYSDVESTYDESLNSIFSWETVTGTVKHTTKEADDDNAFSLQTVLVTLLRGKLENLPDSKRHLMLNFGVDSFLAMTNHSSDMHRVALIRMINDLLICGGPPVVENFAKICGFNLLANQIGSYPATVDIVFACVNLFLGQPGVIRSKLSLSLNDRNQGVGHQFRLDQEKLVALDIKGMAEESFGAGRLWNYCSDFECRVEAVVLLLVMMDNVDVPSEVASLICQALTQLVYVVPGVFAVLEREGIVRVIDSYASKISGLVSEEAGEDDERLIGIESFFGDLKALTTALVICCCRLPGTSGTRLLDQLFTLVWMTTEMSVNQTRDFSRSLLYHIVLTAFNDFQRGDPKWTPLRDVNFLPTSSTVGFSDSVKKFQQICTKAVSLIVHTTIKSTYKSTNGQSKATRKTLSYSCDENGTYGLSLLHRLTDAMVIIVGHETSSSSKAYVKVIQSAESHIRVQFGRLVTALLSPRTPEGLCCLVLVRLDEISLLPILASLYTSSPGRQYATRLTLYTHRLISAFDEGDSLDRKSNGRRVISTIFSWTLRSGMVSTKLNLTDIFKVTENPKERRDLMDSLDLSLNKAEEKFIEKDEADDLAWTTSLKENIRGFLRRINQNHQKIKKISSEVTQKVFHKQSLLKFRHLTCMKERGYKERHISQIWRGIVQRLTHERCPLFDLGSSPRHWQLDPTEGPDRIRKRFQPSLIHLGDRYYMEQCRKSEPVDSPFAYLFHEWFLTSDQDQLSDVLDQATVDEKEKITNIFPCSYISPGNCAKGEFLLGNLKMYFQAEREVGNVTQVISGDAEPSFVSWTHSDVIEIHCRRYRLTDTALELFLLNGKSLLFSFKDTEKRDELHRLLLSLKLENFVDYEDESKGSLLRYSVEKRWKEGLMTNFQYLIHLNKMAGRTFNDLMQYPVFPFILADYVSEQLDLSNPKTFRDLSKPISVQDESKTKKFKENYKFLEQEYNKQLELGESEVPLVPKPYHYGSHYSNSGIVLHYIVRLLPFTTMFLDYQDGNFDVPDRTFHNMESTWRLVSSQSPSDVKEMIPEFFYLPELLINLEGFDFGVRQTGQRVADVLLPPWAGANNARLFILKHRQALECEHVSRHLNKWIDLVFGYKQTGQAAVDAVNVFHPSTYFGAVNLDEYTDPMQRLAVEAQIQSYGQSPKQLFTSPHPQRTACSQLAFSSSSGPEHFDHLEKLDESHPIFSTAIESVHDFTETWNQFAFLGCVPRCSVGVLWRRSYTGVVGALHCLPSGDSVVLSSKMTYIPPAAENGKADGPWGIVSWGFYDGSIRVRQQKSVTELCLPNYAEGLRVTCCGVSRGGKVFLGDSHGAVTVWQIQHPQSSGGYSVVGSRSVLCGHDTAATCLTVCSDFGVWVTGSEGGDCIIWDLNRLSYIRSIPSNFLPVTSVAVSSTLGDIAVGYFGEKSELHLWAINASPVAQITCNSLKIHSLAFSSAAEGINVNVLAAGLDGGVIRIFSSWDLTPLYDVRGFDVFGPVVSVAFSNDSRELYGATRDGSVVAWKSCHVA